MRRILSDQRRLRGYKLETLAAKFVILRVGSRLVGAIFSYNFLINTVG